jgi:hypothetical protein
LGNDLDPAGVFTWAPFIFLKTMGKKPLFLAFLPFRFLASLAARTCVPLRAKNYLTIAGHLMIPLGILDWVPYLYLKLAVGQSVEVMNYLPYHLTGVLGGVSLHFLNYFIERRR